jgi:hypothetical protein
MLFIIIYHICYEEHMQSIRFNREDSNLAVHMLNMNYTYGPMEKLAQKMIMKTI